LETKAETSHPENSEVSQTENDDEKMNSSTNIPCDFERTPPYSELSLSKRLVHSSLE
jgi:hypothetical protein